MTKQNDQSWEESENDSPEDQLEGQYTERDGEPAAERTVHGQYTRDDEGGPETATEGSYTGAEHPAHERHGKYARHDE